MLLVLDFDTEPVPQSAASLVGVFDVERPRGMVAARMAPGTAMPNNLGQTLQNKSNVSLGSVTHDNDKDVEARIQYWLVRLRFKNTVKVSLLSQGGLPPRLARHGPDRGTRAEPGRNGGRERAEARWAGGAGD